MDRDAEAPTLKTTPLRKHMEHMDEEKALWKCLWFDKTEMGLFVHSEQKYRETV